MELYALITRRCKCGFYLNKNDEHKKRGVYQLTIIDDKPMWTYLLQASNINSRSPPLDIHIHYIFFIKDQILTSETFFDPVPFEEWHLSKWAIRFNQKAGAKLWKH